MPRTAETEAILKPGLDSLEIARGFTLRLAEDIPDDKLTLRACPGSNHAAYALGHIASTDDFFLSAFAGREPILPEAAGKAFADNVEISDDPGAYPSKREIIELMGRTRSALVEWLGTCTPEELTKPVEGDLAQFTKTLAGLPSSLAFHEAFHAGQLSTIRRALEIPRLF